MNLSYLYNAIKKILDEISFHRHFKKSIYTYTYVSFALFLNIDIRARSSSYRQMLIFLLIILLKKLYTYLYSPKPLDLLFEQFCDIGFNRKFFILLNCIIKFTATESCIELPLHVDICG